MAKCTIIVPVGVVKDETYRWEVTQLVTTSTPELLKKSVKQGITAYAA